MIYVLKAVKLGQVYLIIEAVGLLAYFKARGYLTVDKLIKLLHLYVLFLQLDDLHTAADVNTYQIGHRLIGDGHGSTDSAACTCMYVRHYTHCLSFCHGLVHQLDYL